MIGFWDAVASPHLDQQCQSTEGYNYCPFYFNRSFFSLVVQWLRVRALDLFADSITSRPAYRQVVGTHVPLSPSSKSRTGQGAVMPCGWKGASQTSVVYPPAGLRPMGGR